MLTFVLLAIGILMVIALAFVIYIAGGRSRKNVKPEPTQQGNAPEQARASGKGDD